MFEDDINAVSRAMLVCGGVAGRYGPEAPAVRGDVADSLTRLLGLLVATLI